MVHVRVGNYDIPHLLSLFGSKGDCDTARIHRNAVVNEKARQSLIERCSALAVECAG
jgi:hypothetical protein